MTYLKKIFSAVLCMILLCGYTAFAQESEKYDIETTATVLNNIVTVNISIEAEEIKGVVCAALIDGDITCATITEQAEENLSLTFPEGETGDKVKIFLWENILTLKPLCEARVVAVEPDPILASPLYGKKLYVDGDSICYGNGYKGGFGKIIADKYGMELVNNGVGGATLSKDSTNGVKYGDEMTWDSKKYYLKLTSYDPFEDKNTEGFAYEITKEQYENGFGVYPTAYKMQDGVIRELEYSEEMPWGRFYVKLDVATYNNNTVSKYYRMWRYKDADGNESGNTWLWEAYKNGFEAEHKSGNAKIGVARHWLCESVNEVDKDADFVIIEGGINEYLMDRPIGKLSEGETEKFDTTTTIGAMEYICKVLVEEHSDKKVVFLVTPRAKKYTNEINPAYSTSKATWQDYHDAIVSVLKKYNIQYVDLFETEFDTAKEEYLQYTMNNDGVHPTKEGYEKFYVPYLEQAMAK